MPDLAAIRARLDAATHYKALTHLMIDSDELGALLAIAEAAEKFDTHWHTDADTLTEWTLRDRLHAALAALDKEPTDD